MTQWGLSDIPAQDGRAAIVTGTGGLGYETALALARAGADVTIAGRDPRKGAEAVAGIASAVPGARIRFGQVDLANLASIAAFARTVADERDSLDLLINNAGVMATPVRHQTADGFELQFGTNHLGHFALTAHLLPLLRRGRTPRVVGLGSVAARSGTMNFDDLQAERGYEPMPVYSRSKLACLLFALELSRRSRSAGWAIESIAAHPGIARTDLLWKGAGRDSWAGRARRFLWFLFQPAARGALPTLYAATDPAARDGRYYGPDGLGEIRGFPAEARIPKQALDTETAARLWDVSLRLTGIRIEMAAPSKG